MDPVRVVFSEHAAERYGVAFRDVADLVLEEHPNRQRNPGAADWLLTGRHLAVAYNWPDRRDEATARVVTL